MSHDLSCEPGADELEVRGRLRRLLGETPDTAAAAPARPHIPPKPAAPPPRPRDWLDDILDAPAGPEPEAEATEEEPADEAEPEASAGKPRARKPKKPKAAQPKPQAHSVRPARGAPRSAWDGPADPKQSLADAWDRIPHRLKWLAARLLAAAAGWRLGLVGWGTDTAAWFAAGHWASPSAFVLYGLGAGVWALHRRARTWAWPIAWAAAIPASSLVVGVLLYGTGYHR